MTNIFPQQDKILSLDLSFWFFFLFYKSIYLCFIVVIWYFSLLFKGLLLGIKNKKINFLFFLQ